MYDYYHYITSYIMSRSRDLNNGGEGRGCAGDMVLLHYFKLMIIHIQ